MNNFYKLLFALIIPIPPLSTMAQSPEFSLREFASGQVKKGVRSIGMGGDGSTWGNYASVWRDSSTALIDAGNTSYSNQNNFSFTGVGVTLPALKSGVTFFAVALSQYARNISVKLKSPGLGTQASPVHGDGSNQSVFFKAAKPFGKGFAIGFLLSYERSGFDAISDLNSANFVRYQTEWVPSGGLGLTWQPLNRLLFGFRALFNNDLENRIDNLRKITGQNNSQEYRVGVSVRLWQGSLLDIGGNTRHRTNQINHTNQTNTEPNLGFEQSLYNRHFALRAGLDESSFTSGLSLKFKPITLDAAYVNNLARQRIGTLFGVYSNSFLFTLLFDYGSLRAR